MTNSSPIVENVLDASDLFLVQRPSVASGGLASSPNFKVSARHIGVFAAEYFDTDIKDLKLEFKDLQDQMDMVINDLTATIKMITTDHDIRIKVVEDRTEALVLDLNETNVRIDDALAKTRLFLYHKLLVGADVTQNPGEMVMLGDNDAIVDNLVDVTHIEYNLQPTQNIANLFVGETLEITAQRGISGTDNVAFSHRAIFKIDEIIQLGGDRVVLVVTVRNAIGSGLPEYQVGLDNYVRSDFYPIFTISKDEYEDELKKYYKTTGGAVTGDIIINKTSPKLVLSGSGGQIDFVSNFVLRNSDSGKQIATFNDNDIRFFSQINVNNNKIINVPEPSSDSDVATKAYVDATLNINDITEDDLFKAGNKVAARAEGDTEALGFFYDGNSLYFKV